MTRRLTSQATAGPAPEARSSMYISYTGGTLYGALVDLLAKGEDPRRVTIDTLDRELVLEAFKDVGLPIDEVQVIEYRKGTSGQRFVDFHGAAARRAASDVAITCVRSVYDAIREEVHAVRLASAVASIRSSLKNISLELGGRIASDAQVVLGVVDLPEGDPRLADDVRTLAGSVFALDSSRYLVVTTRGALEAHTAGWASMPLLAQLAERHRWARIGLGVGRSAAEAEALAKHALDRCRAVGPFAAVVSMGAGRDIVLADTDPPDADEPINLLVAARRSGLSRATLACIEAAVTAKEGSPVSAGVPPCCTPSGFRPSRRQTFGSPT